MKFYLFVFIHGIKKIFFNRNPLHLACDSGNFQIVEYIIKQKLVDFKAVDNIFLKLI